MLRSAPILADSPAATVIAKFRDRGITQANLARLIRVEPSTIGRWLQSRHHGGTDGLIPARHQESLLAAAKAHRVTLRPADLITRPKA